MTRPAAISPPSSPGWCCGLATLCLPAVAWLVVLGRAVENLPASDDHYSLLPFINRWQETLGAPGHWPLLFEQYNDHRIVFTKVLVVLDRAFFGQLNFLVLQVAGWVAWLLVIAGLIAITPATRRRLWLGLPAALLLLHLEGYTNYLVALDMGNLWVVTFALLAAHGAFSPRPVVAAFAPAWATLSALAFTNGLLVFPAVVLGLLLTRRFRRAALFTGLGAALWTAYFVGYHPPAGAFSLVELARKSAIMTGGFLQLARTPDVVTLVGGAAVLLAVIAVLGRPRLWRELPAHGVFMVFTLLSVATAARGRAGWGDYYMTQDRYRLYGLLMGALLYLIAIEFTNARQRTLALGAAGGAALYSLLAYASFNAQMRGQQEWCRVAALNWQLGQGFANVIAQDWPKADAALRRSHELGTYRFPTLLDENEIAIIRKLPGATPEFAPTPLDPNGSAVGYYVRPPSATAPAPDFGVLITAGRPVILPVEFYRARIAELISHPNGVSDRFGFILPRSAYSTSGPHAVFGLRRQANQALTVIWSGVATFP